MARKGENIRKRKDGRWEARYQKGRKADGSILYGYVYAPKYTEVKKKRNEIISTLSTEPELPPDDVQEEKILFDELFEQWKSGIREHVRESSFCLYETMLEHHLRPCFGKMDVSELTSGDIQEFISNKIKENLSPTYIRSIMILFQTILKTVRGKYQWNFQMPDLQLPKSAKKLPEIFTAQEWKCLEGYLRCQDDEFSFGILICMYTGMRIGELSGLRWEDYDPRNVQFKVRRTVYRIKNTEYATNQNSSKTILCIGSPKTSTSVRDIPLPLSLQEDLQARRREPETFVLTGTKRCMEPRNIQKKYRKLLEQLEMRYLNFHSLRHNFATLSIQSGSDYRTVAELLGHSSVNTTLNIYVHSDIDQKRKCLEKLLNQLKTPQQADGASSCPRD